MPNGKMTTRDYVIEIHTNLENLKEGFEEHKKNHKWMWGVIIGLPPAIFYILKLLER
jgi:hypothetical protein